MATLAAEAGVSRSTAYRHTGGRRALLRRLTKQGLNIDDDSPSTRTRILTAVRSCVAQRGVVGISIELLAAEAGVSPMTVYRLFGDRKSLLREALAEIISLEALRTLKYQRCSVVEALETVATEMIRLGGSYPGLTALMLVPASADQAELTQLRGSQLDVRAELARFFERRVALGELPPGDALERAGAFSGLCLGASLLLHEVRPLQPEEVVPRATRVVRRFLNGLSMPQ